MKTEAIREHVRAKKFRPFELHLVDGKMLPIPHPDFILFAPSADEFVVVTPDNSFNILDGDSVARIRLITERKPPAKAA